jgi:flagellar biosynthesis protein FliP
LLDPAVVSVIVAAFIGAVTVSIALVTVRWQRSDRWAAVKVSRESELEARVAAAEERDRMKEFLIEQLRAENLELLRRLARIGNGNGERTHTRES